MEDEEDIHEPDVLGRWLLTCDHVQEVGGIAEVVPGRENLLVVLVPVYRCHDGAHLRGDGHGLFLLGIHRVVEDAEGRDADAEGIHGVAVSGEGSQYVEHVTGHRHLREELGGEAVKLRCGWKVAVP